MRRLYYNQTQDIHPPLFYFLLNTVCSLFRSFTKWTGLGMNFVLLGCTLAALYALGMELFADWKKALFVCALYAFNREMISTVTMVRTYTLMTLLTILLGAAGGKVSSQAVLRPEISSDRCNHLSWHDDPVFLCWSMPSCCAQHMTFT
ncbi:hypothetical protein [Faecalibacterium prausnitzii]|uniref:hypothetical protein n=1 Tax=Faecalibacterium prausnitzii TaxID=853 RepID=UPI003AAA6F6D